MAEDTFSGGDVHISPILDRSAKHVDDPDRIHTHNTHHSLLQGLQDSTITMLNLVFIPLHFDMSLLSLERVLRYNILSASSQSHNGSHPAIHRSVHVTHDLKIIRPLGGNIRRLCPLTLFMTTQRSLCEMYCPHCLKTISSSLHTINEFHFRANQGFF